MTRGCYDIEFEWMLVRMMRRRSENPCPQMARPGVGPGHAERLSTACWRRLGFSEFSDRPKYRKTMFGTKIVNDLRGKKPCSGEPLKD